MAWEQRGEKRYYYRSVRNGKKVKKVYFGSGAEAAAVAEMMEVSRLERERRNEKTYLSIFRKEIWHVRAVELWSRLGSGRCAGWDELEGGEFFSEDRFARVKPRLDFCQDIAEREMVQPF
jgi:hypothetical protein